MDLTGFLMKQLQIIHINIPQIFFKVFEPPCYIKSTNVTKEFMRMVMIEGRPSKEIEEFIKYIKLFICLTNILRKQNKAFPHGMT